jgi:hypothetical protein
MISIESIAHMNARGLAARLGASAPAATVGGDVTAAAEPA